MKTKNQKTQKCVIKQKTKFEEYKNCLEATELKSTKKRDEDSLREYRKDLKIIKKQ